MRKLILPKSRIGITLLLIGILAACQYLVRSCSDASTKVGEGICTFKRWGECRTADPSVVGMYLDYKGKEILTTSGDIIVSYLKKPGPIPCDIYANGSIWPRPRK